MSKLNIQNFELLLVLHIFDVDVIVFQYKNVDGIVSRVQNLETDFGL